MATGNVRCKRCKGKVQDGHETPICGTCYHALNKACREYVKDDKGTHEEAQEKFFFPYLSDQAKQDIRRGWKR